MNNSKKHNNQSGIAMVELSIVLPILLLVILSCIELKRYMALVQQAQVLAREAASQAYKSCSDFSEPEGDNSNVNLDRTQRCVVGILGTPTRTTSPLGTNAPEARARSSALSSSASIEATAVGLETFANRLISANITVSIYRYDDLGDGDPLTNVTLRLASIGQKASLLRLSGNSISGRITLDENFISANQRLAIAEVFAQYQPIIPFFARFIPTDIYEISIL